MARVMVSPSRWRDRAVKLRVLADDLTDPHAKEMILGWARDYDVLAQRAEFVNSERQPQLASRSKRVMRPLPSEGSAPADPPVSSCPRSSAALIKAPYRLGLRRLVTQATRGAPGSIGETRFKFDVDVISRVVLNALNKRAETH
jgi:hypothetical protein